MFDCMGANMKSECLEMERFANNGPVKSRNEVEMKAVHWNFRTNEGQLDHLQGPRPHALSAFPSFLSVS